MDRRTVGRGALISLAVVGIAIAGLGLTFGTSPAAAGASPLVASPAATVRPSGSLPWTGTTIALDGLTEGSALDPSDGLLYVVERNAPLWSDDSNVSVINTTTDTVVTNLTVGAEPVGIAYDAVNGFLYVADSASGNISILNGTSVSVVGSFNATMSGWAGGGPETIGVDPVLDELYVGYDGGSTAVAVFNATSGTLVTTFGAALPVPGAIAYDPANGEMYASIVNESRTLVVNATTNALVTQLTSTPAYGLAYDPANQEMVVVGGGDGVEFLNSTTNAVVNETRLWLEPAGAPGAAAVYDPSIDTIFLTASLTALYAFNATTDALLGEVASGGYGNSLSLAPGDAVLYGTGNYGTDVWIVPAAVYPVTVNATGTPPVSAWEMNVSSPSGSPWTWFSPLAPNGTFLVPNGTYDYVAAVPEWLNSTAEEPNGSFTVDGAAVELPIAFSAVAVYPVTFTESGLPSGSNWSVTSGVASSTNRSATSSLDLRVRAGALPIAVAGPADYSLAAISGPGTPSGSEVYVSGAATYALKFAPTVEITFTATGLPSGSVWGITLRSARTSGGPAPETVSTSSSSIAFAVGQGTYRFAIATKPSTERATVGHGSVVVGARSIARTVKFVEVDARLTFVAHALPRDTAWTVNLSGPDGTELLRSTSSSISVLLTNGSYAYSIASIGSRTPTPATGTVTIVAPHAVTRVPVHFSTGSPSVLPVVASPLAAVPISRF